MLIPRLASGYADDRLWKTIGHRGRNFRILALDGHGASSLFVARVLARLDATIPNFLDQVDDS